jgi:hypothetical protein
MTKSILLSLFFSILCLNFFITRTAKADPLNGYDFLGLQHPNFNLSTQIDSIPKKSALGILWSTFGESTAAIEEALQSGKFDAVRIHLSNGPGLRNNQLGNYENLFGYTVQSFDQEVQDQNPALLESFRSRAQAVRELLEKYPNVGCYISPVLEHNLSTPSFRILADVVFEVAPNCAIVNNPLNERSIELRANEILEIHGLKPAPQDVPYIISLDGEMKVPQGFSKMYQDSVIRFLWKPSYNCREEGRFVDPRERTKCL